MTTWHYLCLKFTQVEQNKNYKVQYFYLESVHFSSYVKFVNDFGKYFQN